MKKLLFYLAITGIFGDYATAIDNGENNLERFKVEKDYAKVMQEYLRQAASNFSNIEKSNKSRLIASTEITKTINSFKGLEQYAGYVFFKKGDLRDTCEQQIEKIAKMGFDGVAFFYPVH